MTKYITGFIPYGTDDEDIIIQESLRSASDIGSATWQGTAGESGAVFDSDKGVQLNGLSALQWTPTAGQKALLQENFRITFWISKYYIDTDTTIVVNETAVHDGTNWLSRKLTGGYLRARTSVNLGQWYPSSAGCDDQVRYDICGGKNWLATYVDYALIGYDILDGVLDFTTIDLGYEGIVSKPATYDAYIRDFEVSTRALMPVGVDPRIRKINMYGDSFGTLGSYPNVNTAIVGTVADGTSTTWVTTTSVSRRNAGHFYTLHRQLAKSNIGVPYLNHWAEGGSGVVQTNVGGNKLDSRLDASLVDPYQPPNIAVILIGANDLDTQLASEANADAWEAAYKVELDKLINAGVELIIINDLFSKVKNAVGTPTDYSTNIARGNVRVANIAADPSYLPYVKAIAVSDWSVATPDSLNADGVHPSPLGFNYIGKRIAEKILAFL